MEIRYAAQRAFCNRPLVTNTEHCGCYGCLAEFAPQEIKEWTDEGETALCPFCGIDSVLADNEDCAISKEFLEKIHRYWF